MQKITEEDINTIDRMQRYGGSFVGQLGEAACFADSENLRRLKEAFPDLFKKYGPDGIFSDK